MILGYQFEVFEAAIVSDIQSLKHGDPASLLEVRVRNVRESDAVREGHSCRAVSQALTPWVGLCRPLRGLTEVRAAPCPKAHALGWAVPPASRAGYPACVM
jgi:hypothetical protein